VRIEAAIPPGLLAQQKVDSLKPSTPDTEATQPALQSTSPTEDDNENTETSKGVLGLLQEGHFKGVADVRLRINFSDELAAIEQAQNEQIVSQKIDVVLESVSSTLSSAQLTDTPDVFIDPFEQAVNESRQNFLAAEVQSTSVLTTELESAFDTLIVSLTEALAPTAAETPEEGNVPVDTTMDEDTPVSDLIAGLKIAFSSVMDDLTRELSGAITVLPELSEPNGTGVAYDKFLKIYNEMQTPREPADTTSITDPLDTSA